MPEKRTVEAARKDLRSGKSASTAAGEFVRQEMHHIREGKHGAKSAKQAIAIGLSEARRAGVPIPDKKGSRARPARRKQATSAKRSRASLKALKAKPRRAASHLALSRQAHQVARKRTAASRSASAKKAARTRAQHAR